MAVLFYTSEGQDNIKRYDKFKKVMNDETVLVSFDRGATWENSYEEVFRFNRIILIDKNEGKFLSTNRGATWKRIEIPNISDEVLYDIKIFPNPTNENTKLTLNLDFSDYCHLEIVDIMGNAVYHETIKVSNGNNEIDLLTEILASGFYFVRIYNSNIEIHKTFIVE